MRDDANADHYRVLGVPHDATTPEIRRAYRRLARRHHPDANPEPGGAGRFAELAHAYQILIDPARRGAYDHALARGDATGGPRQASPIPSGRRDRYRSGRRGILELSADEAEQVARQPLVLRDAQGGVIVLPAGLRDGDEITVVHAGRPVVLAIRMRTRG